MGEFPDVIAKTDIPCLQEHLGRTRKKIDITQRLKILCVYVCICADNLRYIEFSFK